MKKLLITTIFAVFAVSLCAGTAEDIKGRLDSAVKAGNAAEAAQWAIALKQYREADLASEQTKVVEASNAVLEVYGNVIKSAPAILNGLEALNNAQGDPDSDIADTIAIGRCALKLVSGPLTEKDVRDTIKVIDANQKAREEKWKKIQ